MLSRYAPSDPVKRPGSGDKLYDVLRKMNPETKYREEKDPGAWATGVREYEPEGGESKLRAFDSLRNKLRQEKKLPPLLGKDVSQSKDYWGRVVTHYKVSSLQLVYRIFKLFYYFSQNKGREKTNLDMVKDLMSGSGHSGSRLNYRDESSGPIQSPGAGDTTFGQQWSRSRQLRKHGHRRQKNKVSLYTAIYREPSRARQ